MNYRYITNSVNNIILSVLCDSAVKTLINHGYTMHDMIIHKNIPGIITPQDKCFSIIYISSGSAVFSLNKLRLEISAPVCFCLNEKETLQIHESKKLSITQILFLPQFVNSGFDFHNLDPASMSLSRSAELDKFYMLPFTDRGSGYYGYFAPDPEQDESLRKKIKKLISDYADRVSPFRPCRQRSSFLDLLLFLSRNFGRKKAEHAEDSLIEKAVSFFTDNYQEKITIPDLCSRLGTNRNTLAKKFREEKGTSVMGCLAEIRISMAASLLVKTELPVADILYRVGFNDTAHFGRTFKKFTGVTPSGYRKSAGRK